MSHLPRPDLAWLIGQRQRLLRGRELTRWERLRQRLPSFDWADGLFLLVAILSLLNAVIGGLMLLLVLATMEVMP